MAKIGSLQVTTALITNQAINLFFSPAGSSITVANITANPTMIWIGNSTAGATVLTRDRDGRVLFTGGGYLRALAVDDNPNATETYTVSGTGAWISGAFVRRK